MILSFWVCLMRPEIMHPQMEYHTGAASQDVQRHRIYVYLLLASTVYFGLYPGNCECHFVDTLDSIICLQRVSTLCFV